MVKHLKMAKNEITFVTHILQQTLAVAEDVNKEDWKRISSRGWSKHD
jgi:hypothetical protein